MPADRQEVVHYLVNELGTQRPTAATASAGTHGKRIRNTRLRHTGFEFVYVLP